MIELKGKIVPEFMKIRKFFHRKKKERLENLQFMQEVRTLLADVNKHYNVDNISKRDAWMDWVNNRADVYDGSIADIKETLNKTTKAVEANTQMTEKIFIENSRDRIIDFATKVADPLKIVSKEEFNRIFKVYDAYEEFLEERHLTNGEVDVAISVIRDSYKEHIKHCSFLEDVRNKQH